MVDQLRILTRAEYVGMTRAEVYARETERLRRDAPPVKRGKPLVHHDELHARARTRYQRMYARRRAAGQCVRCGDPANHGEAKCERCRLINVAYWRGRKRGSTAHPD